MASSVTSQPGFAHKGDSINSGPTPSISTSEGASGSVDSTKAIQALDDFTVVSGRGKGRNRYGNRGENSSPNQGFYLNTSGGVSQNGVGGNPLQGRATFAEAAKQTFNPPKGPSSMTAHMTSPAQNHTNGLPTGKAFYSQGPSMAGPGQLHPNAFNGVPQPQGPSMAGPVQLHPNAFNGVPQPQGPSMAGPGQLHPNAFNGVPQHGMMQPSNGASRFSSQDIRKELNHPYNGQGFRIALPHDNGIIIGKVQSTVQEIFGPTNDSTPGDVGLNSLPPKPMMGGNETDHKLAIILKRIEILESERSVQAKDIQYNHKVALDMERATGNQAVQIRVLQSQLGVATKKILDLEAINNEETMKVHMLEQRVRVLEMASGNVSQGNLGNAVVYGMSQVSETPIAKSLAAGFYAPLNIGPGVGEGQQFDKQGGPLRKKWKNNYRKNKKSKNAETDAGNGALPAFEEVNKFGGIGGAQSEQVASDVKGKTKAI